MSSFFTLPASSRKRKRPDSAAATATRGQSRLAKASRGSGARNAHPPRDDSISGSDSEDFESASEGDPASGSDASSDDANETGADRRLRLAERYLANVRSEVEQQVGFDAEEVDRDLIAERLKEDVAESKGRMYRLVATSYDYRHASSAHFRFATDCVTGVAVCAPHAYTVTKDAQLTKWELPVPPPRQGRKRRITRGPLPSQRPTKILTVRGNRKGLKLQQEQHTAPIFCVAASPDGRFVATGGQDKKLIMWSTTDLTPLRAFKQHRDSISGLAIDRTLNRLYSASYDRTIKTWGLNDQAYIETLFGHQDHVVDVAALPLERCLSVGARDRTVRLWKVADETQLVFRGGSGGSEKAKAHGTMRYAEGRIDRVAMIDDETFMTAADNGSLSLWTIHKKKPIFTLPLAHGADPALSPQEAFAERDLTGFESPAPPSARWITALATVPYSNLVVTGSWDGFVRIWRVSDDRKRLEAAGAVGASWNGPVSLPQSSAVIPLANGDAEDQDVQMPNGTHTPPAAKNASNAAVRGVVNDLAVFERGARGGEGLCIVAALGKTHRLGRWVDCPEGKNGAVVFEVSPLNNVRQRRRRKKREGKNAESINDR